MNRNGAAIPSAASSILSNSFFRFSWIRSRSSVFSQYICGQAHLSLSKASLSSSGFLRHSSDLVLKSSTILSRSVLETGSPIRS
ncbi:Uncharacterised protein [Mycobacteroides abscessus subsp. abscessus]|nr:Uncharacterised protein [Mycobacteroides abscessus subsp. abscessus]